jgi:release factor glutamine methyltransferase
MYTRSEAENIFYIVLHSLERKSKTDIIVGSETLITETYQDILVELKTGVPVQYLTQEAPFYNLDLFVDERVLIPRPETEQLVHLVIEENKGTHKTVLDIGTGSGCIPLAIKNSWPEATVSGCDVSPEAMEVATKNKKSLDLDINLFQLDILKEEIEQYDIIVSNPPYIAESEKSEMHKNVLENEPHLALFVKDADPLIFYKKIVEHASNHKSTCYFETSEFYRESLDEWLDKQELNFEWKRDFQGKDRILKVTW